MVISLHFVIEHFTLFGIGVRDELILKQRNETERWYREVERERERERDRKRERERETEIDRERVREREKDKITI